MRTTSDHSGRVLGLALMGLLGNHALAQKIPACPAGAQSVKVQVEGRPYIHFECKTPQKTNNMEMCLDWEGTHWDTSLTVCGSRVSSAIEYTGELKCPISEQVYLWNDVKKTISKDISCLPPGWGTIQLTGPECPRGYVNGSPAIFGQDNCYGPRPTTRELPSHDLLAHDINGFALDMTLEQVREVAHRPLELIGGDQAKVTVDGIKYDFGFSSLGHLFRIDSDQNLGYFITDQIYANTLTKKMTAKFGPAKNNGLPNAPLTWGYVEPFRDPNGSIMTRDTLSLSALLMGGYGQPITLHLKLMDFRILRRDLAKVNAVPRSRAEDNTKF